MSFDIGTLRKILVARVTREKDERWANFAAAYLTTLTNKQLQMKDIEERERALKSAYSSSVSDPEATKAGIEHLVEQMLIYTGYCASGGA
jgi:hypothetical protein